MARVIDIIAYYKSYNNELYNYRTVYEDPYMLRNNTVYNFFNHHLYPYDKIEPTKSNTFTKESFKII